MPRSRTAIALSATLVIGLVLIGAVLPPDGRAALVRLVVVAAGIAVAALSLHRMRSVTFSTPERFEAELRRPAENRPSVASLRAAEMAIRLSTASALDFDVRLRPLLRDLARWRLLTNRGVDMAVKPEAAARILGEPLASLIGTSDESPVFGAPGASLADIDAGLEQLERI